MPASLQMRGLASRIAAASARAMGTSLPGLTRQSINRRKDLLQGGWMRGSSPRMTVGKPLNLGPQSRTWVRALGGMSGVCCTAGVREAQLGERFVQGLPILVGERGLDQTIERYAGIASPEQLRNDDLQLIEFRLPAFAGVAVALHEAAHARDLHGQRIIGARRRRHQVEPFPQRGAFVAEAQGAAAQMLELR